MVLNEALLRFGLCERWFVEFVRVGLGGLTDKVDGPLCCVDCKLGLCVDVPIRYRSWFPDLGLFADEN